AAGQLPARLHRPGRAQLQRAAGGAGAAAIFCPWLGTGGAGNSRRGAGLAVERGAGRLAGWARAAVFVTALCADDVVVAAGRAGLGARLPVAAAAGYLPARPERGGAARQRLGRPAGGGGAAVALAHCVFVVGAGLRGHLGAARAGGRGGR
nr:hypothetical protein [Tanacetum cinerariifolium]